MTPWQRDLIATAGALLVALGAYLILPALAFLWLGGALLWLWNRLVAEQGEGNDDGI